jgi:hypothetical protein
MLAVPRLFTRHIRFAERKVTRATIICSCETDVLDDVALEREIGNLASLVCLGIDREIDYFTHCACTFTGKPAVQKLGHLPRQIPRYKYINVLSNNKTLKRKHLNRNTQKLPIQRFMLFQTLLSMMTKTEGRYIFKKN